MEKWCREQTDQDLWVTITDAISMELIGHISLNWFSPSGLLLKWGINPSHSLKCMMTDSGKWLPAGLFAYSLLTCQPNLPCGKALIKTAWCLISCDYWHNNVLQRAKLCFTMWQFLKGGRGLQRECFETVFHMVEKKAIFSFDMYSSCII